LQHVAGMSCLGSTGVRCVCRETVIPHTGAIVVQNEYHSQVSEPNTPLFRGLNKKLSSAGSSPAQGTVLFGTWCPHCSLGMTAARAAHLQQIRHLFGLERWETRVKLTPQSSPALCRRHKRKCACFEHALADAFELIVSTTAGRHVGRLTITQLTPSGPGDSMMAYVHQVS